jgi:hypothetical protein
MISISFVVVLLATYCYSIPIEPRPTHLTPEYEFTTGQTIVDRTDKINMHVSIYIILQFFYQKHLCFSVSIQ